MNDAQVALRRKFEALQEVKEHRQYFRTHRGLYQALNLVYNEEWEWAYILNCMWDEIWSLPDLMIKNGHIKPPMMDDLMRNIYFNRLMIRG
jgi:hypothetical protein